jgi:hypothetical protein
VLVAAVAEKKTAAEKPEHVQVLKEVADATAALSIAMETPARSDVDGLEAAGTSVDETAGVTQIGASTNLIHRVIPGTFVVFGKSQTVYAGVRSKSPANQSWCS